LSRTQLAGECLGAPAIANGRIYVHSTERLYCFGSDAAGEQRAETGASAAVAAPAPDSSGPPARLCIVPAEILARPGERVRMEVRALDADGRACAAPVEVAWDAGALPLTIEPGGMVHVSADAAPAVGELKAKSGGESAVARVRIVPNAPFTYDFEALELVAHPTHKDVLYAEPPAHWIGAGRKWEVRGLPDGEKALAKTLDNPLLQRSMSFFGHPDMADYTMQADILSDGNARSMSSAGVIHQRYLIQLKGNHQEIEVSSNVERIKASVPFRWESGVWVTLKTRVDVAADGSGVVRAKAWRRGEAEPEAWSIEVPHRSAHRHGAPGLFGFVPQSRFPVYVDNLSVTPND
jgi:hypothetical protein